MSSDYLTSDLLTATPMIIHGFFTRNINDRAMMLDQLGIPDYRLITLKQVHGTTVIDVSSSRQPDAAGDALVTDIPGYALTIATADCGPLLLTDSKAGVIGAAHAGWRGALAGIIDNTLAAMIDKGAKIANIKAALGPTISRRNYEVDHEFKRQFIADDANNYRFFYHSAKPGRAFFDLPNYIIARLHRLGINNAVNIDECTYGNQQLFYSYRRATITGDISNNGRLLSLIALKSR